MAKAFGDRMVYPFVLEVENYMKDISTDMGYDENIISMLIVLSSSQYCGNTEARLTLTKKINLILKK